MIATLLVDTSEHARYFKEAYKHANFAATDSVKSYLMHISTDGQAWMRGLPAKATGASTLGKYLSAVRYVLKVKEVREELGADHKSVQAKIVEAFADLASVRKEQAQRKAAKRARQERLARPAIEKENDIESLEGVVKRLTGDNEDLEAKNKRLDTANRRLEAANDRLKANLAQARAALFNTANMAVLGDDVSELRKAAAAGMQVAAGMQAEGE